MKNIAFLFAMYATTLMYGQYNEAAPWTQTSGQRKATENSQFNELGIAFDFQDHHYFHSIYIKDPDNNTVELTTIVVDPATFY